MYIHHDIIVEVKHVTVHCAKVVFIVACCLFQKVVYHGVFFYPFLFYVTCEICIIVCGALWCTNAMIL